jgi:hypothetical protein
LVCKDRLLFYESRDRSILSQLFHGTIKLLLPWLKFLSIASIASRHHIQLPHSSCPLGGLGGSDLKNHPQSRPTAPPTKPPQTLQHLQHS